MIKVDIIGYLGADAKVVESNGSYYARFDVGVSRRTSSGDAVTTWVQCTKSVPPSGNLAQYLAKGQQVFVRGTLSATAYISKNGGAIPTLSCRVEELELIGKKDNGREK